MGYIMAMGDVIVVRRDVMGNNMVVERGVMADKIGYESMSSSSNYNIEQHPATCNNIHGHDSSYYY